MNIGSLFPDICAICGFKGWQPHPFLQKLSKFGGPYIPHHWSDWPTILDLVLWVPKRHVYQVSLKSETVGFKFSVILGDLTRNDPVAFLPCFFRCCSSFFRAISSTLESACFNDIGVVVGNGGRHIPCQRCVVDRFSMYDMNVFSCDF